MKKLPVIVIIFIVLVSCSTTPGIPNVDFRAEMRKFVIRIADYSRNTSNNGAKADFIVIPQNGQEIITYNGEADGNLAADYIQAIDGVGREDLYYGYTSDNVLTPEAERDYFTAYLDRLEAAGIQVLATDYCSTHTYMDNSYTWSAAKNYISFAAPERALNVIPDYPANPYPHSDPTEANYPVNSLADAKNFLYLINPDDNYSSKTDFLTSIANTDYDVVIMDAFFGTEEYTSAKISGLKQKKNGGSRLIIAYMSIGEAEDYRYYWKSNWSSSPPEWLGKENPDWPGNYKVWYWEKEWQDIILGGEGSYLQKILDAGFDGVYLDIIDAFEYFENY